MNTIFIKVIFLLISIYILLYCCSYAIYEAKNKNNIIGCITIIIFTFASLIFGNILFWIN